MKKRSLRRELEELRADRERPAVRKRSPRKRKATVLDGVALAE